MHRNNFTKRCLGPALLVLGLSALPAMADRAMAVCVQAQLAISGFSPGVIDGRLGPKTRSAIKALKASAPDLPELPELNEATSYEWCRALGRMDDRLAAFWPARMAQSLKVPAETGSELARTTLRGSFEAVQTFFETTYAQSIVGRFTVLGGDTPQALSREAERLRKADGADWEGLFPQNDMVCPAPGGLSAVGFRDMLLLCWGQTVAYDAAWQERYKELLSYALAREYGSAVLNDLAGLSQRQTLPSGEYTVGPRWLAAGAALLFQADFEGDATKLADLEDTLPDTPSGLVALRDSVGSGDEEAMARFAAQLLAERYGRARLFEYFEALRSANAWNGAFEATFGMRLEAFEANFDAMRQDPGGAERFVQGL